MKLVLNRLASSIANVAALVAMVPIDSSHAANAKPNLNISAERALRMQKRIAQILSVDSQLVCTVRESTPVTQNRVQTLMRPVASLVEAKQLASDPGGFWYFERHPDTNTIKVTNYIGHDFGTIGSEGQVGYDNVLQEAFVLSPDGKTVLSASTTFSGVDFHLPPKGQEGGYKRETKRDIDCGSR